MDYIIHNKVLSPLSSIWDVLVHPQFCLEPYNNGLPPFLYLSYDFIVFSPRYVVACRQYCLSFPVNKCCVVLVEEQGHWYWKILDCGQIHHDFLQWYCLEVFHVGVCPASCVAVVTCCFEFEWFIQFCKVKQFSMKFEVAHHDPLSTICHGMQEVFIHLRILPAWVYYFFFKGEVL